MLASIVYFSIVLLISVYLFLSTFPTLPENPMTSVLYLRTSVDDTIVNNNITYDNVDSISEIGLTELNDIDSSSRDDKPPPPPPVICRIAPAACNPNKYVCPQNYDPYCGCDGKTYENYCTSRYNFCNRTSKKGTCAELADV